MLEACEASGDGRVARIGYPHLPIRASTGAAIGFDIIEVPYVGPHICVIGSVIGVVREPDGVDCVTRMIVTDRLDLVSRQGLGLTAGDVVGILTAPGSEGAGCRYRNRSLVRIGYRSGSRSG